MTTRRRTTASAGDGREYADSGVGFHIRQPGGEVAMQVEVHGLIFAQPEAGLPAMWGSAAWAQSQLTPGVSALAAPHQICGLAHETEGSTKRWDSFGHVSEKN